MTAAPSPAGATAAGAAPGRHRGPDAQRARQRAEPQGRGQPQRLAVDADIDQRFGGVDLELRRRPLPVAAEPLDVSGGLGGQQARQVARPVHASP